MSTARRLLTASPRFLKSTRCPLTFGTFIQTPRTSLPIRKMADLTTITAKDAAPAQGPYSHAVKTPTAIYCSGSIPMDSAGNLVEGTITEKTAQVFKNLKAVLTEAGSSLDKVVKVNIFLADMGDFAEMNVEYGKWLTHKPARSCVAVKTLPKNVDVEIECIALP
ncbi:endoribonuclease L-PSP [Xylariaceae sp. FL1272]|nr:endoribonuclease L-PSP [Xylariaceae sp. FL1272]